MPPPDTETDAEIATDIETTPWLGAGEVLVHIGVPKTGSTAIQQSMTASRASMAEQGVVYPDLGGSNHYVAALTVLGRSARWDKSGAVDDERWRQLMQAVADQPPEAKVILSAEILCEAGPEIVQRIVDDIGRDRVRILLTLRSLESLIPSTWQQYVKAGSSFDYETWLRDMMRGSGNTSETPSFWRRNNHGRLVERWSKAVGADRVAVAVIEGGDRRSIYDLFEDIIGLRRDTLQPMSETNRSLSANEVELLRRVNEQLGDKIRHRSYDRIIRRHAVRGLVERQTFGDDEPRLFVPEWAATKAREFGREAVGRIEATGATVFGQLSALVPDGPTRSDPLPSADVVPVEAAALLVTSMFDGATSEVDKERAKVKRLRASAARVADGSPHDRAVPPQWCRGSATDCVATGGGSWVRSGSVWRAERGQRSVLTEPNRRSPASPRPGTMNA